MDKKRNIYWNGLIPEELRDLLSNTGSQLTQEDTERDSSMFKFGTGETSNISLEHVDWSKIDSSPQAFINKDLFEWDIPKLIFKRFFAGEGSLGPEEGYKSILLKSNTLKIIDGNAIGYYSDIITAAASELKINPVRVRNFTVTLLTYLDYLKRSDLVSFPIEIDYGLSQDSFFLQVHCENNGVFLENIVDSAKEESINPFDGLVRESLAKTDLLELYTLKSTNKLVITGCWIGNPKYIRNKFYSSLLIHQIDSFQKPISSSGKVVESQPFFNQVLPDLSKISIVEQLPEKYILKENNKQLVNPMLVKRIGQHILKKWEGSNITEIPPDYNSHTLKKDIEDFPGKEMIARLNQSEEVEILKVLKEGLNVLERDIEEVKRQIKPDDYLEGILSSLERVRPEDVLGVGGKLEESQTISGSREDLTEESQRISGSRKDLTEESQTISGSREDLTEESQRINGSREDLTEESQRINGSREDLTEESQRISGSREDLTEESQRINGSREDLTEESQKNTGSSEDLTESVQLIKGENNKEDKTTIKGEANPEKQKVVKIGGNKEALKNEVWDLKRLEVAAKIKEKVSNLQTSSLDNVEIDQYVKSIIVEELGVDQGTSEKLVKALSDNLTNEFVNNGLESANENIKQRIQIEKIQNQLSIRDKQVQKMKALIEGLKKDLAQAKNVQEVSRLKTVESNTDEVEINIHESTHSSVNEESFEELKGKNIEFERELQKIKNENHKLTTDNQLLMRKLKEGIDEVNGIKDSDEDAWVLKQQNENLNAQIEALKKRLSFMYENSKNNKEVSLGVNEVQKLIEDKERFFAEKMKAMEEITTLKADVRERERLLKQKDLDFIKEVEKIKNNPVVDENGSMEAKEKEKENEALKVGLKQLADELKATQLKTKSYEQKVKFLNVQLEKFQARPSNSDSTSASNVDPIMASKLKQSATINARLKDAADKLKNELTDKKAELHKVKQESRAMDLKMKDLEKKLATILKKTAA
ncbi:MAG: hypothetical protein K9K67_04875 [Bacteriovoracaceae bacterium]|nr:hypothetical protein [Bacteriovoracaceae bacterium]